MSKPLCVFLQFFGAILFLSGAASFSLVPLIIGGGLLIWGGLGIRKRFESG